jgi:hypothetical protein
MLVVSGSLRDLPLADSSAASHLCVGAVWRFSVCWTVLSASTPMPIKKKKSVEFLSVIGVLSFTVSLLQAYAFEGSTLASVEWPASSALCVLGYIRTLYASTSVYVETRDAAVFNVSLLTTDFLAVVAIDYLFNKHLSSF